MKKNIIAFDLDGCITNLIPALTKMCASISGIAMRESEWITYGHFANVGLTPQAFIDGIVSHSVFEGAEIHSGAAEAINAAQSKGYEIAIITQRGFHPKGVEVTTTWLDKQGMRIDHLILVNEDETKVMALKSLQLLGNVVAYVDDYLPHLEAIETNGSTVELFVMDSPWNQDNTTFSRLFSVDEYVGRAIELTNESQGYCAARASAA